MNTLYITILFNGLNLIAQFGVYSQPQVKVYRATDPYAVHQQVQSYLHYFDVTEDILLTVTYSSKIPKGIKGMTYCVETVHPLPYRIIKIRVSNQLSTKVRERILAHEMVHVKQYVKGELSFPSLKTVRWKGISICQFIFRS